IRDVDLEQGGISFPRKGLDPEPSSLRLRAGRDLPEVAPRQGIVVPRQLLRRSLRYEPSTRLSTLRTQLDHVVARGTEIQVVLDENHRRASPLQLPQHAEEHQDVTAMEPHRGLVEQEERPLGAALR